MQFDKKNNKIQSIKRKNKNKRNEINLKMNKIKKNYKIEKCFFLENKKKHNEIK